MGCVCSDCDDGIDDNVIYGNYDKNNKNKKLNSSTTEDTNNNPYTQTGESIIISIRPPVKKQKGLDVIRTF